MGVHNDMSDWVFQEYAGIHERPFASSEASYGTLLHYLDSTGTYSYGVTFRTRQVSQVVVAARIREAVGRFRFYAPIVACSAKVYQEQPLQQSFVYKPAKNAREVKIWAEASLTIEAANGVTLKEYLAHQADSAFPYVHPNGRKQYFGCFLLCHEEENAYSFVGRIAHGFVDGRPWLNFIRFVLDMIASPDDNGKSVEKLEWGTEWKNLPESPATLARRNIKRQASDNCNGDHDLVWEEGWRELQLKLKKVFNRSELGESLKPPKHESTGKRMARAIHQIDADTIDSIKSELKTLGHNMAVLIPAVHMLTIFQRSRPLKAESYITLDLTMIDTSRFFPVEYSGPLTASSRTGFIPLTVEVREIDWNMSTRDHLISLMKNLEKQVKDYLRYPQLTLIDTVGPTEPGVAPMHPHTCILSYIGVVDLTLPPTISNESGAVELEILDFGVTHRHAGGFQRPSHIFWCFRGKFNLMIQGSDHWDPDFFEHFLKETVDNMLQLTPTRTGRQKSTCIL